MPAYRPLLLLLLALAAGPVRAQEGPAAEGAWLWKVQPEGAEAPSWILAVLHHPDPAFAAATRHLDPWFGEPGSYAAVRPADPADRRALAEGLRYDDAKRLRKTYRGKEWAAVEALVERRFGDGLASWSDRPPLELRRRLLDAGRAPVGQRYWDDVLAERARDRGKPLRLLATPADWDRLTDAVALDAQLDALRDYGARPLDHEAAADALARPYLDADWDALRAEAGRWLGGPSAERLLDGMALAVALNLRELAVQGSGFFAVDAELLGGPKGVLERLRRLGTVPVPVAVPGFAPQLRRELGPRLAPAPSVEPEARSAGEAEALSGEGPARRGALFPPLDALPGDAPQRPWETDPFGDLHRATDTAFLRRWTAYRGPRGDYRARFPYTPNVDARLYRGSGGTVDVQMAALNDAETGLYLLVTRTAYPERFRTADAARFFDDAVADTRTRFEGRVIADRPLSTPLYRGRAYVLAIPGGRYVRGRLLLADRVLYHQTLVGTASTAWSDAAQAFLEGFRLYRGEVDGWALVEAPGFRARMPLQPARGRRRLETPGGPVEVEAWSMEDPLSGMAYLVSVAHYPPGATRREKAFLEDAAYGIAARLGGPVLESEALRLGRHHGRSVLVSGPDRQSRLRLYLRDGDLYQVMVSGPPQALRAEEAAYFLDSFRFR